MPRLGLFSSGWGAGERVEFGASDYWRLAVPGRELARNGWEVIIGRDVVPLSTGEIALRSTDGKLVAGIDVILWQRWMGQGAPRIIRNARAVGQAVVNDVDDYFWAIPRDNVSRNFTDPRKNPTYNREIYKQVIRASTLVTVSTPWLKNALERWGPPVRVVRNYVALDKFPPKPPGTLIGWVGVLGWRGADLQILAPTVVPWLRERGLQFYHGGHANQWSASRILGYENVTVRPAVDLSRYASLWDPLGVALIPIELSTFGMAKSYVKGLEACCRGIPFIATDHPEYRALGVGRLAKRPRDWVVHLDALEDPAVRAAEGARNRARAEELSISNHWQKWDATLRTAIELERSTADGRPGNRERAGSPA